jgi:predicted glycoside hydrolase/deacetylase ChbG (UPF0249 family)
MMRRLVINADDLGADEARNEGIFDAIEAGVVTSASLLANGPALEDALARIRALKKKNVSFGFHLNLSQGTPLSEGHRLLVGPDGNLPGKIAAHKLLMQRGNEDLEKEIAREMEAQVERLRNAGVELHHMDGHQHVHVFPAVASLAVRLAERHGIRWMRMPDEPAPPSAGRLKQENGALFEEAEMFSGLAARARVHLDKARVKKTDAFRGLYLKGRLSVELLREILENLPGGLTELMVHPGRVAQGDESPFSYFSTAERLSELKTLMDERFRAALARCGVSLVSFMEV